MEEFQRMDSWVLSSDVSSLLACTWKTEQEETGFVPRWDDDIPGADYVTGSSPVDGFDGCNLLVSPYSPGLNQDLLSQSWLDETNIISYENKLPDGFSVQDVLSTEGGTQLCGIEVDGGHLPEVNISELESLLWMDSDDDGPSTAGARRPQLSLSEYITVGASDLESLMDNSDVQVDHRNAPTVSSDVDESSTEEDDSHDVTWSYRTSQPRRRLRRCVQRRPKSNKRLPATTSRFDERKKLQNKTAATRYREKKRSEELENEMMCAELEKRNKQLRTRVQDMTQEVAVLRKLVVDIFRSPNVCTN